MTVKKSGAATDYSKMTAEEKKLRVEQLYIKIPRYEAVKKKIEHCRIHSKISSEPVNMLITGGAGAGKTTLIKSYVSQYPRYDKEDRTIVPVLCASIPAPATVKGLATMLLAKLGDPFAESGSVSVKTLRLCRLVKECRTELNILDEFQHFIDRDSEKILRTVSDWLKEFLNETGIPTILIGLPYSDEILDANEQLERRFLLRESLASFGWEDRRPEKKGECPLQDEFRTFLKMVEGLLPLRENSNLSDWETAYRLYCASNGIIYFAMLVIRGAAILAIEQGRDSIDLELLAQAYPKRLLEADKNRMHPFETDIRDLKIIPFKKPDRKRRAFTSRSRASNRDLRASDVL